MISNYLSIYWRGFFTAEILSQRLEIMATCLVFALVTSGLRPIFKLLTYIIIFLKDLFQSWCQPQQLALNLADRKKKVYHQFLQAKALQAEKIFQYERRAQKRARRLAKHHAPNSTLNPPINNLST